MALKDITLGQYFPGTSVIHRLDPRTKLLGVILYIVALFLAKSWISYGLYYGTLGISVLIDKLGWYMPDEAKYIIGAVISGLICYIVWLKKQPKK